MRDTGDSADSSEARWARAGLLFGLSLLAGVVGGLVVARRGGEGAPPATATDAESSD
jgi:hypothetical protein